MKFVVQPVSGFEPIVAAIKRATTSIHIVIFRFDVKEIQKALEAAVQRGVTVHALIAHTNRGGEKRLRKLELELLEKGVTVSRTGDDLVRYHGKMMIADGKTLHLFGFNFTYLDILKSRSFGVITSQPACVQEALRLFEADTARQPYVPGADVLVVSPENARAKLAGFIKAAKKELLIYDPKIADGPMIRLLNERAKGGVSIRVLGKVTSRKDALQVAKLPKLRLHVRAILRDGSHLFIGSQSLRPLELDRRREVGVIVRDASVIKQFRSVFDADWGLTEYAGAADRDARESAKPGGKQEEAHEMGLAAK
jgi:phosphatidylserine/phosphatidylglycerophosphate/cardiolipin synthase-like enzyme